MGDLDDDLRRLFSDERLDVHSAPISPEAVVRGANRRRRRRNAVAGAFVLLTVVGVGFGMTRFGPSGPNKAGAVLTTTPPMNTTVLPVSPRYGPLELGMPRAAAVATGVLVVSTLSDDDDICHTFATTELSNPEAVVTSPTRGIVRIMLPIAARTSENMGFGSTVTEVTTAYPGAVQNGSNVVVPVDFTPPWSYVFETDGTKVTTVYLRLNANDDCLDF